MNINLKRKIPVNKPVTKKPRAGDLGFNNGEDGNSSESETEEMSFTKSVQAKSQKIAKQISKDNNSEMDKIISMVVEPDSTDAPRKRIEGLKYMNKLLDSKKQRERDRMISRQEYRDKQTEENKDSIVFESEDYKKQQQENFMLKEQERNEDEDHNNAQFYSKILQIREGVNDTDEASTQKTLKSNKILNTQMGKQNPTAPVRSTSTLKVENSIFDVSRHQVNEKNEYKQLLERLRSFVKSKIRNDDIHEYKKRYWNRREN